jgi:Esterase-like activity of phytase
MPSCKSWTKKLKNVVVAGLWLTWVTVLIAQLSWAEDRVTEIYTFPKVPIRGFQNLLLPGSVAHDRKILLGSVGSDLWRGPKDPRDEFWMVTDRGPNGQRKVNGTNRRTFLVPEFNPMILRVKTQGNQVHILEALPIVGQSGKPVTGLPNLQGMNETPYNYSAQELLHFNPNGLDTEGLIRTTAGDFWIAEEYGPSLVHVDRTGKVLKRYIPEGLKLEDTDYPVANALPAIYGKRKINRGFEGLALSNDDKTLYVALQSPLLNPDRETGEASRNTRVLVFDIATEKVTAEYAYRFDEPSQFDPNATNKPDEMKLSALAFLNPTTLLVLERTDLVAKLYSVDMSEATNILNTRWDDATLEAIHDPASAQVRVLPKSLVIDLSSLYGVPEKIEGIAWLDRHTIAVANDNDFDSEDSKYDAEANPIGKGKKTQILVISLSKPLPFPLDSVAAR